MKTKYIIYTFLFIGLIMSCGSSKIVANPDDKLIGNWSLLAEATPQGDVPIIMTISKNSEGLFEGTFKSIMGNFDMLNLTLKNGMISCNFDVQGMAFEFKGVFTNDEFKGETQGPGQTYITNGRRASE